MQGRDGSLRDAHLPRRAARAAQLQRDGPREGEPRGQRPLPRLVPRAGRHPRQRHLGRARSRRSPPRASAASRRSSDSSRRTRRCAATSRSTRSATSPRSCLSDLASGDHRRDHLRRLRILDRRRGNERRVSAAGERQRAKARRAVAARARRSTARAGVASPVRRPQVSGRADAVRFDAVIIGGGHNGLVCAAYLAGAGLSGLRARAPRRPGRRRGHRGISPGLSQLDRELHGQPAQPEGDPRPASSPQHGLAIVERPIANFLPLPDGGYLKVGGGLAATQAEVAKYSPRDAAAAARRTTRCSIASPTCCATSCSPRRRTSAAASHALLDAWKVAKRFRALDLAGQRDVLDLFTKSAGDVLDRWFESAPIKAAFGFDAVVGNFASPYTPGSAYVLLHHVFGEVNGKRGQWGHARGGMGAITAGDGAGVRGARRHAAHRTPRSRASIVDGGARDGRRARERRGRRRRRASSPTSIRSSCSSSWSRPSTCRRRLPRAHRGATAAARERSG